MKGLLKSGGESERFIVRVVYLCHFFKLFPLLIAFLSFSECKS